MQESRTKRNASPLDPATEAAVRQALDEAGCRYTRQRAEVFAVLASVKTHPTVEEVYRAVRRRVPKISLATVYNALEALVSARLAAKLTSDDGRSRTIAAATTTITCATSRRAKSATWASTSIRTCWPSSIRNWSTSWPARASR